jgi:sec-independent protein translocase protein TatB
VLDFSPEKLLLVALIAFFVLGPNRLPQAARSLGRFVADLKRMSGSFHSELRDALAEPRQAFTEAVGELPLQDLRDLRDIHRSVRDSLVAPFVDPPAAVPPEEAVQARAHALPLQPPVSPPEGVSQASPPPDDPSLN